MSSTSHRQAAVVLPTYNEAASIGGIIARINRVAEILERRGISLRILLVDDESPDGTAQVAAAAASAAGLSLRNLSGRKQGLGAAYMRAFRHILAEEDTDLVVTLDADGQHEPEAILSLADQMDRKGLDLVIGSRWIEGGSTPGLSTPRRLLSRLANVGFRLITRTWGVADATTSFRIAKIDVVRNFDPDGLSVEGYSILTAFVALAAARGYKIGEVPIAFQAREGGLSKLGLRDFIEFGLNLLRLERRCARLRRERLRSESRHFSVEHFEGAADQERLGEARRFFNWILDCFQGVIEGRVLEVGAGSGQVTRQLVQRFPEIEVTALEPAANVFTSLEGVAGEVPRVHASQQTLAEYRDDQLFDTVLYLSVLEHVEDDRAELKMAWDMLRFGGHLLLFVPAGEWLYSDLDYRVGHYRRYQLDELRELVEDAGYEVTEARHFDALGVIPYFLLYRILGRKQIDPTSVALYDRMVIPVSRRVDGLLRRPPLGKNIILIAVKTTHGP